MENLKDLFFVLLNTLILSDVSYAHIPTELWTNRGIPVYFRGTDVNCLGTKGFAVQLLEFIFEVGKGENNYQLVARIKREDKPSSLINIVFVRTAVR